MTTAPTTTDSFAPVRRVLWQTMGLNLIATLAKLIVGYLTGSLSLIADGVDSLFDSASNVVGLVGIGVASQPPDEQHPYGHRKAETLAALVIAMLLFISVWELGKGAVQRILSPERITAEANVWSFVALGISMAVHLFVVWYEMAAGRRYRSDILVADAMHTRGDLLISLSVAAGLVAVRLGYPIADPILALGVSVLIAKIGVDIVRKAAGPLMDAATIPSAELEETAMSVPGVSSVHNVRTRGIDAATTADLHIRVDPAMDANQAHAIAHEVQRRLQEQHPTIKDVTIHVEPGMSLATELTQESVAARLRRIADGLGLGVHSVGAYQANGAYHVDVHLEADGRLPLSEAHRLASTLEERLKAEVPEVTEVTTHLEPQGVLSDGLAAEADDQQIVAKIAQLAEGHSPRAQCHSIEVVHTSDGRMVSLHCYLPGETPLAEAHRAVAGLERAIYAEVPGVQRVIVHAEPADKA